MLVFLWYNILCDNMKEVYIKLEELDKNDNILEYIETVYEKKVGELDDIKDND